jgi:hypothetical protein
MHWGGMDDEMIAHIRFVRAAATAARARSRALRADAKLIRLKNHDAVAKALLRARKRFPDSK